VTVDAFDVTNSTFDFAWNGTQKGFESQAQARLAFLDALANVRPPDHVDLQLLASCHAR
jgi:hypothetical protein